MTEYRYIHNSSGRLVRVDALGRPAPKASPSEQEPAFRNVVEFDGTAVLPVWTPPPPGEPKFSNIRIAGLHVNSECVTAGACVLCSPKPVRRFCACGQELFGKFLADPAPEVACGDCIGTWDPLRGVDIQGQRRDAPSLDQRIRAAQPETEEHAWESTHWSWP